MTVFIRKNLLVATATFVAADGTNTQPSTATLALNYNDISGVTQNVQVPMTFNSVSDDWIGTWDTSNAKYGNVDWMIFGVGSLQAATQGSIQIEANKANNV
jgi:hypothetical protein